MAHKLIYASYCGFVTFVKSNAKALSTAVPSIKSTLAPCRGLSCGTYPHILFRYSRPDIFQIPAVRCTIPLPDSSPFWSAPTDHQLVLPGILHNEILYQSINLMTINHIYRYCCYNLIFLLSLLYAPFYYPAVSTL